MVDALHTPGPWHVENRIHVKAENGWLVATASVPSGRVGSWGINPADNARLIAAAPDLLAALIAARNTLAGCGMPSIAAGICDAAIAKATATHSTGEA